MKLFQWRKLQKTTAHTAGSVNDRDRAVVKTPMHNDTYDEAMKPLLILGDGRSGTTLLMELLGTAPQIVFDREYPYEIRYLTYLMKWALLLNQRYQPGDEWNFSRSFESPGKLVGPLPYRNPQFWSYEDLWKNCFRSAWDEFSQCAASRLQLERPIGSPLFNNARRNLYYAEKSPFWLPAHLREVLPYHVILIVRDPRDVYLSITAFVKKRGLPGFARLVEDDDWTFAKRFRMCRKTLWEVMRREEASPNSLVVKYEDLVLNLDREAMRISNWLGMKLNAGAVETKPAILAHHATSENKVQSVARWQRELPAELNEYFVRELHEEMRHFGYV